MAEDTLAIPLGKSAYSRTYANEPEIRLVNRIFEKNPTNQKDAVALLKRPGSTQEAELGIGPIRILKTQPGIFDGDLFAVSSTELIRYSAEGVETNIIGTVAFNGTPSLTFVKGAGYERLFVADGAALQWYGGQAWTDTLTVLGTIVDDGVGIDGVYYQFAASAGAGAGTLGNPYKVTRGASNLTALTNLRAAINDSGVPGVDYSTGLVANARVESNANSSTTLSVRARLAGEPDPAVPAVVLVNGTPVTINNPDTTLNIVDRTVVDRTATIPNNTIVGSIGVYSTSAITFTVKVVRRNSAGNYDILVSQSFSHAGAGWQDLVLTHPYVVPASGTFYLAAYAPPGLYIPNTKDNVSVANFTGNASGSGVTFTETTDDAYPLRYTVSEGLDWAEPTFQPGPHVLYGVATPDGVAIDSVATLASFILCAVSNSQRVYFIRPGEIVIDPLDFFEAESIPDDIVQILTVGDQAWMLGQSSTESWYATGDVDAPFAPAQGRAFSRGTIEGTPVILSDSVMLVGEDGIVYRVGNGLAPVSTNGIEERIRLALARERAET